MQGTPPNSVTTVVTLFFTGGSGVRVLKTRVICGDLWRHREKRTPRTDKQTNSEDRQTGFCSFCVFWPSNLLPHDESKGNGSNFECFKQRCNRDFKTVNRLENTTNLSIAMVGHWAEDLYSRRAQRDTAGQKVRKATNAIALKTDYKNFTGKSVCAEQHRPTLTLMEHILNLNSSES